MHFLSSITTLFPSICQIGMPDSIMLTYFPVTQEQCGTNKKNKPTPTINSLKRNDLQSKIHDIGYVYLKN